MESDDLVHWLLRNAGPIIKYRTLRDIVNEQDIGTIAYALEELLKAPPIPEWLERLQPDFEFNALQSGRITAYENVMGKLVQLGLRAGLQPFDNRTLPFRAWLSDYPEDSAEIAFSVFLQTIVASFLSFAGYGTTQPVSNYLKSRLEVLYSFAHNPDFHSVYVDKSRYKGIPKSYDAHRLVNPELCLEQRFALPWIHDIRGIAYCNDIMENVKHREQAEVVARMILTEEYQALPWNYGIVKYGKKYYVVGWAIHLPGYSKKPEGREFAEMLLTLETMAIFKSIRKSKWFTDSLQYLEEFQSDSGTYVFPRAWLPEKTNRGYWVGGEYMAFDDRKGRKDAIECESTFRVLTIKKRSDIL
ncbi:MAG: hypothetical protein P1Q69_10420 [Candidatus Thorarchaeota archaeon]|nr:hypothetical protein [Candidatus Thorarchaeota archaeon]